MPELELQQPPLTPFARRSQEVYTQAFTCLVNVNFTPALCQEKAQEYAKAFEAGYPHQEVTKFQGLVNTSKYYDVSVVIDLRNDIRTLRESCAGALSAIEVLDAKEAAKILSRALHLVGPVEPEQ